MNNELANGLLLLSAVDATALTANYIRNKTENNFIKEVSAIFETGSHLISYAFYSDMYVDGMKHAFDAEIIARANYINPTNIYFAVPYLGERMIVDIEETIGTDINLPIAKYIAPYFLGKVFKVLSEQSITKPMFEAWEAFTHIPEMLPAPRAVGLISAITYNLINIPTLGNYLDNKLGGALTEIDNWKENPGGDTWVGKIYNEEILYYWGKLHLPHHFYEEILAIEGFYSHDSSPLLGEIEILIKEFS